MAEKKSPNSNELENIGKKLILAIFLGTILSLGERAYFTESQFYLGSYIVTGAMIVYAMKYNEKFKENSFLTYVGRELSLYIYIIHIAVGHMVNITAMKHGISMQIFSYINMFFILVISVLLAQGMVCLKRYFNKEKA